MGIILRHQDTPKPILEKMASSRDAFVKFCNRHSLDADELMEAHRRRLVLADSKSARAILRKMHVKVSQEEIDEIVASAAVLEKVAFLGSITNALGYLATFGLGRILKWGTGIALLSGLIYYLGKAGFLGSPKKVDPAAIEAAKKAGVPHAERVMPYAAAVASDQSKLKTIQDMTKVLCRKSGRCQDDGTMAEFMKLMRNKEGNISGWAATGFAGAVVPTATSLVGGVANAVKNVVK
jgi:hypothetical protein